MNPPYLPLTVDESAAKVRIVGTAAPTSAVEYIVKFVEERREELEQYKADMAAGKETDPYLLILTPQKSLTFLKTYNADAKLRALIAEWSEVPRGHGPDYWRVAGYCSAAWNRNDNFAVRKVLHEEQASFAAVHDLLLQAFDRGCGLADLGAESIVAALGTCDEVAKIVSDDDRNAADKSSALADLVTVDDIPRLVEDLTARPLMPLGADTGDEGDEAIETAGSMAPIELLSLVGSKGLSAQHVIIIGCEEGQDLGRIARFAEMTRSSRRQVTSLDYPVLADDLQSGWVPSCDPLRLDRLNPLRALARTLERSERVRDAERSR